MIVEGTQPPADPGGLAEWARVTASGLADALAALAEAVRRADGQHVDLGPGAADKRLAAREVAEAAESARAALETFGDTLTGMAEIWRRDGR